MLWLLLSCCLPLFNAPLPIVLVLTYFSFFFVGGGRLEDSFVEQGESTLSKREGAAWEVRTSPAYTNTCGFFLSALWVWACTEPKQSKKTHGGKLLVIQWMGQGLSYVSVSALGISLLSLLILGKEWVWTRLQGLLACTSPCLLQSRHEAERKRCQTESRTRRPGVPWVDETGPWELRPQPTQRLGCGWWVVPFTVDPNARTLSWGGQVAKKAAKTTGDPREKVKGYLKASWSSSLPGPLVRAPSGVPLRSPECRAVRPGESSWCARGDLSPQGLLTRMGIASCRGRYKEEWFN